MQRRAIYIPLYFAILDCLRRPIHSSDRKVKIRSWESYRVKLSLILMWYRVDVVPILQTCPVRGYVLPNFPKCPVPESMLYRYWYQLRYRRPHRYRTYRCRTKLPEVPGTGIDVEMNLPEVPGTGIDIVTNLTRCPVPVMMLYRSYQSIRCRY